MNEEKPQNLRSRPAPDGDEARPALRGRPPVVVVMGHVDHGKTTLLDYIRKTNVAAREAGGITQAVGAYEIVHSQTDADWTQTNAEKSPRKSAPSDRVPPKASAVAQGRKITFIDTPGHEAFAKMRSRGAEVADIAILVVAAEEGVKPQTKEAIDILNQTKTPFIVAINKIDKTGGNIEKAKNDLAVAGVYLEGYGGQVSYHGISAKTGEGVSELLDVVILATDLENLTFDPAAPASGYILEVSHDARRGIETSAILKNGVLKRGQPIYTKTASGKVKILENFLGKVVNELEPAAPALIVGFEKAPQTGELFSTSPIAQNVQEKTAQLKKTTVSKSENATLNLILKASDAGSLEALSAIVKAMEKVDKPLTIIEESVGDVTDGDLNNAIATRSHIIGFKVKVERGARNLAEAHEIKIVTSEIIYDLVKTVEEFFKVLGKPVAIGELEVLAVFNQKKLNEQLIGGRVLVGVFRNKASFDIMRLAEGGEAKTDGSGKTLSLREKKAEINQAEVGKEIGLLINSQVLIKVGDRLVIRK